MVQRGWNILLGITHVYMLLSSNIQQEQNATGRQTGRIVTSLWTFVLGARPPPQDLVPKQKLRKLGFLFILKGTYEIGVFRFQYELNITTLWSFLPVGDIGSPTFIQPHNRWPIFSKNAWRLVSTVPGKNSEISKETRWEKMLCDSTSSVGF